MKNKTIQNILSDEDLLHQFLSTQNASVFGELYQKYIPLVYGLSLKYLRNKDAAQDAVMDIFEKTLQLLPKYEIKTFKTWLYSVSKNHCLQILRKEKQTFFVDFEEAVMESDDFFTLIDVPQNQQEADALAYCMTTLPEVQQKSIHYFYIEEKSYAEIVNVTGFTLNNVKSYIQNGKRNLKSCLIKRLHL